MKHPIIRLIIPTLFIFALIACKGEVKISMNENVPPSFNFSGASARVKQLPFFIVTEVAPENQNLPAYADTSAEDTVIWQIWPKDVSGNIEDLPTITYGIVPPGFIQKVPENGDPPPLVEGKVYHAGGPQIMIPKGFMRFTVRNGKAVRLPFHRDEF